MKKILFFLGAVAAVALLFAGNKWIGELKAARIAKWKSDSTAAAADTRANEGVAARKDTVYVTTRTGYTVYRDRAIAAGPLSPRDSQTFAMCDQVVRTCDERHAADTAVAAALRRELAVARARPTERPPRFTLYGEGLYDVLSAAPVFRAGAELRLLGGISAAAAGDLAIPPSGETRVQTRALVGIRYVF